MNVIEIQPNTKQSLGGNLTISPSNAGDAIYPIGSLYLTLDKSDVCPLQKLGFGVWEKVPSNLCLQSAPSSDKAGNTVEAGLPNIKGRIAYLDDECGAPNGAFYWQKSSYNDLNYRYNPPWGGSTYYMDASRYNPIYKDSCNTVQPPALYVNVWKRVA